MAAATLVLGVAVALCAVALHGYLWGLLLGLAATAATLVALPAGWARIPFGAGWAGMVGYCTQKRPEGDFVIAQDRDGWILLGAAVVVLICCLIGTRARLPVAPPSEDVAPSR